MVEAIRARARRIGVLVLADTDHLVVFQKPGWNMPLQAGVVVSREDDAVVVRGARHWPHVLGRFEGVVDVATVAEMVLPHE